MDYASNSKKDRERSELLEKKETLEKVISGEVVQKPKGISRRFKDIFFGGDAKDMVRFVAADVLLPALRNLVVDAVTQGTQNLVYGQSRMRRPGPHIDYRGVSRRWDNNPISRPYQDSARPSYPSPPALPRGRQNRRDIADVIVETREEAELVIERLQDVLEKYDVVPVADLYNLLGLETSHVDQKWGWTSLLGADVRQIRDGFLLQLPSLEEI